MDDSPSFEAPVEWAAFGFGKSPRIARERLAQTPRAVRTNFVLTLRPYPSQEPPAAFCERTLAQALPAFVDGVVGSAYWVELGSTQAVARDVEYEGSRLRQMHALGVIDGQLVHFVGTSGRCGFRQAKEIFLRALRSLWVASPAPEGTESLEASSRRERLPILPHS
ncbi:MAG: hypothetical protein HY791_25050 [Deltaproteobacteria bacterium]|nr:hypothetical protein [Deltaproteobacteria bacterium]